MIPARVAEIEALAICTLNGTKPDEPDWIPYEETWFQNASAVIELLGLARDQAAERDTLREALRRAAHLGSHLVQQVPEFTGVIGPGGEREDDYIRDNLAVEFEAFAALAEGLEHPALAGSADRTA